MLSRNQYRNSRSTETGKSFLNFAKLPSGVGAQERGPAQCSSNIGHYALDSAKDGYMSRNLSRNLPLKTTRDTDPKKIQNEALNDTAVF